jgi:Rad3-related DNA helicase
MMSATLNPTYLQHALDIDNDEFEFIDLPSPFAPMRRRILYNGVVRMNRNTKDEDFNRLIRQMDEYIEEHAGERGIIHTVSYGRAFDVMQRSRFSHRMISHRQRDGTAGKNSAIEQYLRTPDAILVSPSVGVGEDFGAGDGCRFQFIIKWPIPSMGDPIVKARVEEVPDSLWWEADQAFVQAVGRGTRSATDHSTTYVLDALGGWRIKQLPATVQAAVVDVTRR